MEAKQITAAVTLWREYFWPHARACIRQIGLTERHVEARRVLRWLRATNTHGSLPRRTFAATPVASASMPIRPRS